jgi:outer membrane autotransporter protein
MKKTATTLALATFSLIGSMGQAHAQAGTYLGVQFSNQKISVDGESDSDGFVGLYGGIKSGSIAYEAAISQKSIEGFTFRIIDGTFNPHFAINPKADFVTKIGFRHSSTSIDNVSVSGTSLLLGLGLQYQLADKVTGRVMYDYAPRAFGENIKNTSLSVGVAYNF